MNILDLDFSWFWIVAVCSTHAGSRVSHTTHEGFSLGNIGGAFTRLPNQRIRCIFYRVHRNLNGRTLYNAISPRGCGRKTVTRIQGKMCDEMLNFLMFVSLFLEIHCDFRH